MPKAEETVLEIDLGALAHNYKVLRAQIDPDVKFMAVVKAFAYGNDSVEVAKKLEELGADYFAVAYTHEGTRLREAGITKPILVFHPQVFNFQELIDNCLEPSLYSESIFDEFVKTSENLNLKDYPVHIKFNTGMNRLGFTEAELPKILDRLSKTNTVKVASAFSHLAASEDWKEREFTLKQINTFRSIAISLINFLEYEPLLHICNTSGIFNYPGANFNMVRSGLGLYGFGNDTSINTKLKPIGTLKTVISQIQYLAEGDSIGYNREFIAARPTKSATIALGYADGIGRNYGNGKAGVFINGKYAPIIGNICMDITMVDVTDIDCNEGDEVVVFGAPQNATQFAEAGSTISYELLAGITQRVRRIIIPEESKI